MVWFRRKAWCIIDGVFAGRFLFCFLLLAFSFSLVSAVQISPLYPDDLSFNVSQTIELNATITDTDDINVVVANITYPNSTVVALSLVNQSNDLYNISFTIPQLPGTFTFSVWANDTLGNAALNSSNFTSVFSSPSNIPGLQLWLDATDNSTLFTNTGCTTGVSADLDEVLCWRSKSSDASNITVESGKSGAKFRSNISETISGSTVLRFNKSNLSVYASGIDIRANTTEDVTIFTVYRPRTTNVSDQGQAPWGNDDGSWDRFYYSLFSENVGLGTDGIDDGLISLGGASSGLSIDGAGIVDKVFLLTAVYDGNVSGGTNVGPTNASAIYFDGDLQTVFTDESHATAAQTQMFIGRDGDNGYYDGDIAEMLLYNGTMNACQLEMVNKWLSARYGKDFFNISSKYDFSSPHDHDVNGISEVNGNCTSTVEITSAQSFIANVSSPTSLDLNDSLTFGHDEGGVSLFAEAPGGFPNRLNVSWRVDEDNEPGNVSVSFDLSTTTVSVSSSDFALIVGNDTNFSDASIHVEGLSTSGNIVTFTQVNFSDGDYFSLAINEHFTDPRNLTELRAWYDATDNDTLFTNEACTSQVSSSGDDVRCWVDKSNYSANATNVSGKGIPTFITGEFNGLSVLNFSKSQSDALRHVVPSQYTSNFTIFIVMQSKGDASTYDSFFSNGEPASTDHFQIDYTNDSGDNSFRYGASAKFLFEEYSNDIKLYSVTHNSSHVFLYNQGTQVNNGTTTEGQIFEHYRINQNRNGNQHHHSKIGEIILYGRVLTLCELEKVNVYLGEKYGQDFFGLSDNYGYTSPYDHDVNGIGEFVSSCSSTKEFTSAQSSFITVFNASSLSLGDSLTFGHDEGGVTFSTQVPSGYDNRLNQSWRVDEDSEPGNVSVSFDLSSTSVSLLTSNFALLVHNESNFSESSVYSSSYEVSGSTVTFHNVNFSDGDYVALAFNEKVPLISFVDPTLADGSVHNQSTFIINISSDGFGDDHYTFVNFDNSLLMWLRFDDVNGSGDPTDASGNGNNGTLVGDALINETGRFGSAAHFDGSGDYINLPASNALIENSGAWTMSAWFNAKSIASSSLGNRIITVRNASGLSAAAFTLGYDDKLQFFYRNTSGSGKTRNITTVSLNTWYHYAVTYNGSASKVYIDGVLNSTFFDTIVPTSSDTARIGANPTGSSQFFNGSVDEFLILNHQLTDQEIASLYNATAHQYDTTTTTLADGDHNVTGYTVSINGQKNQTETRIVTIDTVLPNASLVSPVNASFVNVTSQNLTVNASDVIGLSNATLFVYNATHDLINQTLTVLSGTQQLLGTVYNFVDGVFRWFYRVVDTAGNLFDTGNNTLTVDTVSPSVTVLVPVDQTVFFQEETLEIAVNVTDLNAVSFVRANITYPNGTSTLLTLTNAFGDKYNASFSIDGIKGTFNVSFFANDSAGNVNDSESTSFIAITVPFVEFISPTLSDAALHNQDHFVINISSNASGNDHYTFTDFNNSLILWLRMDEVNGSGDPTDIAPYDNNGTLIGSTLINSTGRFGDAAHFDGDGDYISVPDSPSLRLGTSEFAYSVWFNTKQATLDTQQILCKRVNSEGNYEVQITPDGRLRTWTGQSGSSVSMYSSTNISAHVDQWFHVVVTRRNQTLYLYVNGSLENQTTSTHNVSSVSNLFIGRDAPSAVEIFNGSIDDVLIFNRSLSGAEVLSLYNATAYQYDHNLTVLSDGNYSFTGYAVSANGERNQTETRTVTIDTVSPSVLNLLVVDNATFNLSSIFNITVNVSDALKVDNVSVNITLPNATVSALYAFDSFGTGFNSTFSFDTVNLLIGNYTALLIANDTAGNVNSSESFIFEVQNSVPSPSGVEVNGGSDVTLTSASNTSVVGTATLTDLNGYDHISSVTGYFFLTTKGQLGADNRSDHYTSACTSNGDGSGSTVSYNCTFNVSHYAIPTDAGANRSSTNWTFTVAPLDAESVGSNGSDVVDMNTLLSFTLNPSSIDFGSLNLGQNTSSTNQQINVTNNGNVAVDVLLSGTNFSCAPGTIPIDFLEYEDDPFTYGVGTDLLETGIELDLDTKVGNETSPQPLRTTYYGLGSPSTSVGGNCNGTIVITGQGDPHND